MQYRDRHQIIREMLTLLETGPEERRTKTGIMYVTYMSYPQLCEYIEFLISVDWIELDGKYYAITRKGKGKLRLLEHLNSLLPVESFSAVSRRNLRLQVPAL